MNMNLYFVTVLRPRRTGLPLTLYVSPKGNAEHTPFIRVSNTYSDRASDKDWFVVTIEDHPCVSGEHSGITDPDVQAVTKWVQINKDELLRIWDDDVDLFDAVLQHM